MAYLELDRLIECIPYCKTVMIYDLDDKVLFYGTVRDLRAASLDEEVLAADVLRVEPTHNFSHPHIMVIGVNGRF